MTPRFNNIDQYCKYHMNSIILTDPKINNINSFYTINGAARLKTQSILYLYQRGHYANLEEKIKLAVTLEKFERKFRMMCMKDYGNDVHRSIAQLYCLN